MDKMKMHSANKAEENYEALAKLFPNAITETIVGYDEKDQPIIERAIDVDVLRQEISTKVVEGKEERYRFTWPDKKKAMLVANQPINKTLRPSRKESVDFDHTENLYIEGDNLDVLKLLQETYLGKVKMIYIDPPYNTGRDFIYSDNYRENVKDYMDRSNQYDESGNRLVQNTESNGRYHTDWLNMMYPRIKLARNLLTEDGVIFISIDDNEVDNLKKLCTEIFGESNLVAEIPWQSRASIQNDTDFSVNHEYICVYSKNRRMENRRLREQNSAQWHQRDSFVCRPLPLAIEKFDNPDNDPRGPWKADPFDAPNVRPNLTYKITNPNTGVEYLPPRGRCWRTEEKSYYKYLNDNRIIFGKDGTTKPQLKVFYEEKKDYGSVDNSWFSADRVGTSTNGKKELMALFDGYSYFDTPKPVSLMQKLISLANVHDGDIVLDFFSGSATTAHAVMKYNVENKEQLKYIMVQLPENIEAKVDHPEFKTICDIAKKRIQLSANEIEKMGKSGSADLGFRVLKLDESNMKDVFYNPGEYQQSLFDSVTDNIKEDRTSEDLLFQVMLDLGVLLSSKVDSVEMSGKKVFSVEQDYVIACFDDNVTEEVVKEIAKRQPYYAVFRDSSLANDSVATNFEQIFEIYSPTTIRKVL